jgi:hypothetical protein
MRIAQILLLVVILVSLAYVFVNRSALQITKNGIVVTTKNEQTATQSASLEEQTVLNMLKEPQVTSTDHFPPADLKFTNQDAKSAVLMKKAIVVNGHTVYLNGNEYMAVAPADPSRVFNPAPVPHATLQAEGWVPEIKTKTQKITPFIVSEANTKINGYLKNLDGSVIAFIYSEETVNNQTTYRYLVSDPTPMATLK